MLQFRGGADEPLPRAALRQRSSDRLRLLTSESVGFPSSTPMAGCRQRPRHRTAERRHRPVGRHGRPRRLLQRGPAGRGRSSGRDSRDRQGVRPAGGDERQRGHFTAHRAGRPHLHGRRRGQGLEGSWELARSGAADGRCFTALRPTLTLDRLRDTNSNPTVDMSSSTDVSPSDVHPTFTQTTARDLSLFVREEVAPFRLQDERLDR